MGCYPVCSAASRSRTSDRFEGLYHKHAAFAVRRKSMALLSIPATPSKLRGAGNRSFESLRSSSSTAFTFRDQEEMSERFAGLGKPRDEVSKEEKSKSED